MKTESHELRRHCHAHTVWHVLHRIISIVSSDGSSSTANYVEDFCCICIGVGSFSILGEGGGANPARPTSILGGGGGEGGGGIAKSTYTLACTFTCIHTRVKYSYTHACMHTHVCMHTQPIQHTFYILI